jgi:hypothetical protein
MQTFKNKIIGAVMLFMLTTGLAFAQQAETLLSKNPTVKKDVMNTNGKLKTFVIEREITDAGKLTPEQLKEISKTSCSVLTELGPDIKWLQSYVTGNKIYCVYQGTDEKIIREHAKKGGFPANSVSEVSAVISPETGQ